MAREITADFSELEKFVKEYTIESIFSNAELKGIISQYHKKYYSYITVLAEMKNEFEEKQYEYLLESCSDSGTALFHIFHGAYKSSKLILRSSIETFLKGFCKKDIPDIIEETSMYELFRKVKAHEYFDSEFTKPLIEQIHLGYKELCKDVHTAEQINMENISALNHFPKSSIENSKKITELSSKLIACYITLLCHKYNKQYHKIHYKNKDIITLGIPKKKRPTINNIDK